jgi:hypothetical protein
MRNLGGFFSIVSFASTVLVHLLTFLGPKEAAERASIRVNKDGEQFESRKHRRISASAGAFTL